jgi:hypothetical protein
MPCCEDRRAVASSVANPGGAWIELYSVGSKAITVFGPISRKSVRRARRPRGRGSARRPLDRWRSESSARHRGI